MRLETLSASLKKPSFRISWSRTVINCRGGRNEYKSNSWGIKPQTATVSVVHDVAEILVLEICFTSIKIVICVGTREWPVQTSLKTETTFIAVSLII